MVHYFASMQIEIRTRVADKIVYPTRSLRSTHDAHPPGFYSTHLKISSMTVYYLAKF